MLEFVNYLGKPVNAFASTPPQKKPKAPPKAYHKGWRVVGLVAGSLEEAQKKHKAKQRHGEASGKSIADFDAGAWLSTAKRKAVRSKPYGVRSAADTCAELATKAGWIGVQVLEISKE